MKWKTRDGREMEITEMSDRHLINTVGYLHRMAPALRWQLALKVFDLFPNDPNDEAIEYAGNAADFIIDNLTDNTYLRNRTDYQEMLSEIQRRGLYMP